MKALKRSLAGRRRTLAAVAAATVVLGGAGAVSAIAFADDDHGRAHATVGTILDPDDDSDHDGRLAGSTEVGLKQAADAATKSLAGTVAEVETDGRRGEAVWEIDFVEAKGIEREVTVNAADGEVIAGRADRVVDTADRGDAALAESARTGLGQAVDTALGQVPGTVTSAELDGHHGGTAAWHVDVTDGQGVAHEVVVDARTGKVTATHTGSAHSRGNGADDDREHD
ncbi:PepSY domain-containing protein [Streptomyces sp. NPDC056159]|uniref:PepSY domain-containing protein n=1 Tax=Streptomyces sp. NPDC056159 TaxID=3155537 RepID=UPI00342D852E